MPQLAPQVSDLPPNQIRQITEAAWAQPGSLVLSIGEPGFPVPAHVLDAGIATLARDETNYTPNAGIAPLRAAFAKRFHELNGVAVDASAVFVTSGAQQGLHLAMSLLLAPGDEILVPNPGYPTFAMTSRLLNAVPVPYPLYPEHGFQPQLADLEALLTERTRVLMLNSPSNPLGAVFPADLTRRLVELARKHDLWIISDECYEAFTFDVPHTSPAVFDTDGRVFTSFTTSKTYGLTGLRVGALVIPQAPSGGAAASARESGQDALPLLDLQAVTATVVESTYSCVSTPAQYAALAALTGPQDYVSTARRHYRANRDAAAAVLRQKGIRYLDAQGAFYLWADMSHASGGDIRAWVHRFLAEDGVAVAPGTAFGSIGEGWIRIALCGDSTELIAGVSRLPAPVPLPQL
ncbi:pyridoxal phosphate-dependent aminotransferase [Paenarthrobacter sp. Z7-10]|uniref:pyridoxal phosphate-dependent aminotransferase n=1 Tax=Paenarthrobacter sp. Z7-10 TaxID=2787635 RepID=UPI0022A95D87|nr:pyridoxal phosphate-dependent aminotransferase [Paenarthrobacter sp. Z7-10]MCZ2403609.1 pyridoxal phosphate-dependent aminotransferase [Paenarthrobacter sp. Z7-10]